MMRGTDSSDDDTLSMEEEVPDTRLIENDNADNPIHIVVSSTSADSTCTIILDALRNSAPLLFVNMSELAVDLIANKFILSIDDKSAAAINLITATRTFGMLTFSGITLVTPNLTSEAKSGGQPNEVGIVYRQSLLASVIFSIPPMILFASSRSILILLRQGEDIALTSEKFFHYFLLNVTANFLMISSQQTLSGLQKQVLIAGINLMSLPLFYLIGNALSSQERLGIQGVALTYAIRSFGLLGTYHIYFLMNQEIRQYKFFSLSDIHAELGKLKKIFIIGCPVVIDIFGELGQYFTLNLIIGWLGGNASLVQNVSAQFIFFAVTPSLVLSKSSGILIGRALGNKAYENIRKIGNVHLVLGISTILLISSSALLLSSQLTDFFTPEDKHNNTELYKTAKITLAINTLGETFDSVRNILTGSLRGLHDTIFPAVSNNAALWAISIPSAYLFSSTLGMGMPGIALGQCLGMATSNLPLLYRWYRGSDPDHVEENLGDEPQQNSNCNQGFFRRCIGQCFWSKPESLSPVSGPVENYQSLIRTIPDSDKSLAGNDEDITTLSTSTSAIDKIVSDPDLDNDQQSSFFGFKF